VAIGIASVSLALAGLSLSLSRHQWATARNRHRVLGNADEARSAIGAARRRFEEVIAHGGETSSYFTRDENNQTGQLLKDAADRTDDASLGTLLIEAAEAWDNAWGHAPPPRGARVIVGGERTPGQRKIDAERAEGTNREVECGRRGLEKCEQAMARLNELDRTL
jgi:hypothetical protein